jgi:hypothetical protein
MDEEFLWVFFFPLLFDAFGGALFTWPHIKAIDRKRQLPLVAHYCRGFTPK